MNWDMFQNSHPCTRHSQMLWSAAESLVVKGAFVLGEKEWEQGSSGLKLKGSGSE